ncbi:hypothetical protein I5Q34_13810 [Streptomyces sp. AV19]|uniref:hypothetical protein n=1 Tax=Streptomyces sp. AV19 TaxID=2793068 RepID=UPI0018FE9F43|nr:hypothetical protein [Streptomyces sp. AV19]MBH1935335.1 hypothetical protein [Streptomyces sp. AV19]MDG4531221.1 hypothetical protein [Streptomyces sp. AV19]
MPAHSILPHHAHDAPGPVPLGARLPARRTQAGPVPDRGRPAWAVPACVGVVLFLYTVFLAHDNGFSQGTGWLLGLVVAAVATGIGYVLVRERNAMITEVRALSYGALAGITTGFLHSLSGGTWLRSLGIGLACGVLVGLLSYNVFHWNEHHEH